MRNETQEKLELGGIKERYLFADMLKSETYRAVLKGWKKTKSLDGKKDLCFLILETNPEGIKRDYLLSVWRVESHSKFIAEEGTKYNIKANGSNVFFECLEEEVI